MWIVLSLVTGLFCIEALIAFVLVLMSYFGGGYKEQHQFRKFHHFFLITFIFFLLTASGFTIATKGLESASYWYMIPILIFIIASTLVISFFDKNSSTDGSFYKGIYDSLKQPGDLAYNQLKIGLSSTVIAFILTLLMANLGPR